MSSPTAGGFLLRCGQHHPYSDHCAEQADELGLALTQHRDSHGGQWSGVDNSSKRRGWASGPSVELSGLLSRMKNEEAELPANTLRHACRRDGVLVQDCRRSDGGEGKSILEELCIVIDRHYLITDASVGDGHDKG